MTTIRSLVRPHLHNAATFAATFFTCVVIGGMLLLILVATSFFWIPLAVALWFEEKPVWRGVVDWFVNDLINPKGFYRPF